MISSVPETLQFTNHQTRIDGPVSNRASDKELQRISLRGLLNRAITRFLLSYIFPGSVLRFGYTIEEMILEVIKELIHWMLCVASTT